MVRADRSKPQIDEVIGSARQLAEKNKNRSSSMRERTWARYRGFLAPQADSAKPLKQCLQVHEAGEVALRVPFSISFVSPKVSRQKNCLVAAQPDVML
jgi:hypothetical protein